MLRVGLVVVLCWIGGLKAANYEAEGIVPFVANSPLMNFFYHDAPAYREQNSAGGLNVANHEWNEANGTYTFSWARLLDCRPGHSHRAASLLPSGSRGWQLSRGAYGANNSFLPDYDPGDVGA
jgi:hypothetical protein